MSLVQVRDVMSQKIFTTGAMIFTTKSRLHFLFSCKNDISGFFISFHALSFYFVYFPILMIGACVPKEHFISLVYDGYIIKVFNRPQSWTRIFILYIHLNPGPWVVDILIPNILTLLVLGFAFFKASIKVTFLPIYH